MLFLYFFSPKNLLFTLREPVYTQKLSQIFVFFGKLQIFVEVIIIVLLIFFIWYCCSSNNFFYLNNSIKCALPLWHTWFCCFKLLLNYKLQITSAQILNQSISYFYILVIACPKFFWFLIQNNFAKFGDSISFFF